MATMFSSSMSSSLADGRRLHGVRGPHLTVLQWRQQHKIPGRSMNLLHHACEHLIGRIEQVRLDKRTRLVQLRTGRQANVIIIDDIVVVVVDGIAQFPAGTDTFGFGQSIRRRFRRIFQRPASTSTNRFRISASAKARPVAIDRWPKKGHLIVSIAHCFFAVMTLPD